MAIPTTSCSVFIQIWVDTNATQTGSTRGVYLVDNRVASGSQNEGSANLTTACTQNSNICWEIFTIDPNSTASVQIQSIGNSNAWGSSGQPQVASDNANAFTGQAQNPGAAGYQVNFNVTLGTGSGFSVTVSPNVNVVALAQTVAA